MEFIYNTEYIEKNILDAIQIEKSGIQKIAPDEIFVKFMGTENYYISQYGQMLSTRGSAKVLSKNRKADGYWRYFLCDREKSMNILVQRAVAQVFLPDFLGEGDYVVHHIDGNKNNNYFKNLVPIKRALHKKLHNINQICMLLNGSIVIYKNPIDIVSITGLELEEIILAKEKLTPIKSIIDPEFEFYDLSGWLIGYQFKKSEKKAA